MRCWSAGRPETKARLAGSPRARCGSAPVNSLGAATSQTSAVFHRGRERRLFATGRFARGARTLAAGCISSALLLLGAASDSTQPISWEMLPWASVPSLMDASPLENALGIWMARKLYCSASRPCDAYSPFSTDGPFNLRFVTQPETRLWTS